MPARASSRTPETTRRSLQPESVFARFTSFNGGGAPPQPRAVADAGLLASVCGRLARQFTYGDAEKPDGIIRFRDFRVFSVASLMDTSLNDGDALAAAVH